MIPLRDTVSSSTVPVVTRVLIAANVIAFLYQVGLGPEGEAFIRMNGLVPRHVHPGDPTTLRPLLSSMFLHGGWMHLFGNMLYLHIFGDNVEDRLGHLRYLALYLIGGLIAGAVQVVISPHSAIPIVGASGAIAGVTGAYFLFFPRARIVTLVPVFIFLQVVELPAVFFLLVWFLFQLLLGVGSLGAHAAAGGVAFWAHIGGFLAGLGLAPLLAPPRPRVTRTAW